MSDDATGLPPLDDVEPAAAILVLAWAASEGVATSPYDGATQAVRYLSVRGLVRSAPGDDPSAVEWAQVHLAVPVEAAVDVAASLASGGWVDGSPAT